MLYGGASRIRISSQSLKRHWRFADDPHSLYSIPGAADDFRSRDLVTLKVIEPLRDHVPAEVIDAIEPEMQTAVYGPKGGDKATRQTLLLGAPEIDWLSCEAGRLAHAAVEAAGGDLELAAVSARNAARAWRQAFKANFQSMRDATALPAGLAGALFGRMVTSDPGANIAAAIHVAHAFTVHAEESEIDYFSAVDDLAPDRNQVDFADETEISSGLFYGYVVVDLNGLISNLAGETALAGSILHNLTHLIAEVSPGAKLGSTAPYGRAVFMLLEAGSRQPRSLAEAYRSPCPPQVSDAVGAIATHLQMLDHAYATAEDRRFISLADATIPRARRGSLPDIATWAANLCESSVP